MDLGCGILEKLRYSPGYQKRAEYLARPVIWLGQISGTSFKAYKEDVQSNQHLLLNAKPVDYKPHNSFDRSGCLKPESYLAQDQVGYIIFQ